MLKKILLSLVALALISAPALDTFARTYKTKWSDVHVSAHYTKKGTYVKSYYRSKGDTSKLNNYGCIDNGKCK